MKLYQASTQTRMDQSADQSATNALFPVVFLPASLDQDLYKKINVLKYDI